VTVTTSQADDEVSLHGEALKGVIRKNGWSLPV
jgi:hypothetical protein